MKEKGQADIEKGHSCKQTPTQTSLHLSPLQGEEVCCGAVGSQPEPRSLNFYRPFRAKMFVEERSGGGALNALTPGYFLSRFQREDQER
jgi:hypothetical protein